MEKLATLHPHKRYVVLALALCVVAVVLAIRYVMYVRTKDSIRTTPPAYREVSSVTGTDITIQIRQDTQGLSFEHDGQRLSNSNRITGLIVNTEYLLTVTNLTSSRQGIFLPVTKDRVIIDPGQSTTIPLVFRTSGTHSFIGSAYARGWESLTSGFDVSP